MAVLPSEASEEVGAQGAALHKGHRLAVAVAGADTQQTVGGADEVVDLALELRLVTQIQRMNHLWLKYGSSMVCIW